MKAGVCLLAYLVCSVSVIVQAQHRGSHRYGQSGDRKTEDDDRNSREGQSQDRSRQRTEKESPSPIYSSRDNPLSAQAITGRVTPEAFERSFSTDQNSRRLSPRPTAGSQSVQLEQAFNTDQYSRRFTPRPTQQPLDRSSKNNDPDKLTRNSKASSRNRATTERNSREVDDSLTRRESRFKGRNSEPAKSIKLQQKPTTEALGNSYLNRRQEVPSSRNSKVASSERETTSSAELSSGLTGRRSRIPDDTSRSENKPNLQKNQVLSRDDTIDRQNRRSYQIPSRNSAISLNNPSQIESESQKNIENESTENSKKTLNRFSGTSSRTSTHVRDNKEQGKSNDNNNVGIQSQSSYNQRLNSRFLNRERDRGASVTNTQLETQERLLRNKDREINDGTLKETAAKVQKKLTPRNRNDKSNNENDDGLQAITRRPFRTQNVHKSRIDEPIAYELKQVEEPKFSENKESNNPAVEPLVRIDKTEITEKEIISDRIDAINSPQYLPLRRNSVKTGSNLENTQKLNKADIVQSDERNIISEISGSAHQDAENNENKNVIARKETEDINVPEKTKSHKANFEDQLNQSQSLKSRNVNSQEREIDQNSANSQALSFRRSKTERNNIGESKNIESNNPTSTGRQSRFRHRVNEEKKIATAVQESNADEKNPFLTRGSKTIPVRKGANRDDIKIEKRKEFSAKQDLGRRNKENIPVSNSDNILRDVNEPQTSQNFRKGLRDRKNNINDDNNEDKLLATAETITGTRKNFHENVPLDDNTEKIKVNEAQLLSSRARLKELKSQTNNEHNSNKVFSTEETIRSRLDSQQNVKHENKDSKKSSDETIKTGDKDASDDKNSSMKRKLNFRQNLFNSRKPVTDSVTKENSSSSNKDNANKSQRGHSRGSGSYKKNFEEEGSSGRPAKKKDKGGDDDGIDDDDNYPVEYKQLVKAGNGPKEILDLLKARKAQREAAQKVAETLHGQHSIRASLLSVRPQLYQQATESQNAEEEDSDKSAIQSERTIEKVKHRNENSRERSRFVANSQDSSSHQNQKHATATQEEIPEEETVSEPPFSQIESRFEKQKRNRIESNNEKSELVKNTRDFSSLHHRKQTTQSQILEEQESSKSGDQTGNRFEKLRSRNENSRDRTQQFKNRSKFSSYENQKDVDDNVPNKKFSSDREQIPNRYTNNENVEKLESNTKISEENITSVKIQNNEHEKNNEDVDSEIKPKRTYTRRDEQNKVVKEFKIKPTVEVETERPRFVPYSKKTSGSSKDDSTEGDSENDEIRVPGKLNYHLYEPSTRKKLVTQQFKPEIATKSNKDEVRTVTKSYSKLARYPKLPTTPSLGNVPSTTTEGSLAARLNARRLRQQQQSTVASDIPDTLPTVSIVYASSLPTAKPLESDSLVLEQTTQSLNARPSSSTALPRGSPMASNAWDSEVAQQGSTTVKTTAETPTSTAFSTIASAKNHMTNKLNDIVTVNPETYSAKSSTIEPLFSSTIIPSTTIFDKPLINLFNKQANNENKSNKESMISTQKPISTTLKQSLKPKYKSNKVQTTKAPPIKTSPKPAQTNEIIKTSETKQFENENSIVLSISSSTSPPSSSVTSSTLASSTPQSMSSPTITTTISTTTKTTTQKSSSTTTTTTTPRLTTSTTARTTTTTTIPPSSTVKTTTPARPSPPPQKIKTSTVKTIHKTLTSPSGNSISTTTKKPFQQTTRKPSISTTLIPKIPISSTTSSTSTTTTTPRPKTTSTKKPSPVTTTTKKPHPPPKSKQVTTTKMPSTSTKKPNLKRQLENENLTKPSATPIPVFINSTTNTPLITTTTLVNKLTTTTKRPLTSTTKKPEQKKAPIKSKSPINRINNLTKAEDRIDNSPELEESSADFVVYGLLPNKSLVRRVPSPTPRTELPFVVYGLYPNGTIVRRFPNGTIIPDDPPETNELVADTVDPSDKSAISELLQRDQPPTRPATTTTAFTPQTTAVFTTMSPTTRVTTGSTTIFQPIQTTPSTTTVTTTRAPSTTTQRTTTTKKPTTTTKKAVTTPKVTTTTTTTKKPQPTTTTKKPQPTTTTKKPQPTTTTTKKPNSTASKPKLNKQASGKPPGSKKPKQSPSTTTTKKPLTTTTLRPTTAAVVQSATRVAEDFALLNSLLMRNPPDENINANSIAPELMSSTPTMESDDLANRIIQLAIERARPGSSPPTPASALVTLAGTQSSSLQDLSGNSGSPSGSATDSKMASSKPGGKISLWVVPEGETNSVSVQMTTPTVPKLTRQEEQVLNALLSSPSPTRDQLLLAELLSGNPTTSSASNSTNKRQRKPKTSSTTTTTTTTESTFPAISGIFNNQGTRGGGFLRSLGSNTNTAEGDESNEGSAEPRRPIISAAINMSRAVSQFMGLVIQDAVQQLQAYLEERLTGIVTRNNNTASVS